MKAMMSNVGIEQKIFLIRGQKVMIDRDLAELYEVPTKALNQAVRRNMIRFPEDFMFRLNEHEKEELVTFCDQFKNIKHSKQPPCAFTEQGVAMLSSILRSKRAVLVNIQIMRAFIRIRNLVSAHREFARKLNELERKVGKHDESIILLFEAIRKLMEPPAIKPKPKIGFHP